jgi:uncharacterized protein YijF (DUF1287 family)
MGCTRGWGQREAFGGVARLISVMVRNRIFTPLGLLISLMVCGGCGREAHSEVGGPTAASPRALSPPAAAISLGVIDHGIWSDLDAKLQLPLPDGLLADRLTARIDARRQVLIVEVDGWPVKPYPLGGQKDPWVLGGHRLQLRPADRAELAALLTSERISGEPASAVLGDRDDDGIPDPLDVLIGAKKTVLNADAYAGGYVRMSYPLGDVPRDIGVCTDVIVRAVRNAGVDLQRELHEDIARSRRSYPMVTGRGDPNIDHRRVKTLLPYFLRKWPRHSAAFDDPQDPLRPGDIVLMDTFPSRPGPDHIGIVSDRRGPSGLPLIINNWTDGTVTAEMDLLTFVPVTHRFRLGLRSSP